MVYTSKFQQNCPYSIYWIYQTPSFSSTWELRFFSLFSGSSAYHLLSRDSQDLFYFWLSCSPVVLSGETQREDNFNSMTVGATAQILQSWGLLEHVSRGNQCTEIKAKPGTCWGERPETWRAHLYKWESGLVVFKNLNCSRSPDLNRTFTYLGSTQYCSGATTLTNYQYQSLWNPQVEYGYNTSFKTYEIKVLYISFFSVSILSAALISLYPYQHISSINNILPTQL